MMRQWLAEHEAVSRMDVVAGANTAAQCTGEHVGAPKRSNVPNGRMVARADTARASAQASAARKAPPAQRLLRLTDNRVRVSALRVL
jgi:hypothetical protein